MTPKAAVALLACALPMAAQAQSLPRTGYGVQRTGAASIGNYLSKMDADRDGRVSPTEYQDWLSYAFDAMDRNRDGVLSPAEQPGGRGKPLSRAEHRERIAERFRRQDADRNGYLSARELAAPPQ